VVLDKGEVVEEGKHAELLSNKKHYFELWQQQFTIGLESMLEN